MAKTPQTIPLGDIFYYERTRDDEGTRSFSQVKVTDAYIKEVGDKISETVAKLITQIIYIIKFYERHHFSGYIEADKYLNQIFTVDDVVFKCVSLGTWRRGFGFAFLQISNQNDGQARIVCYSTNTVHHSAICFGTTPDVKDTEMILSEYLKDKQKVLADISNLKRHHDTQKDADELLEKMLY